ncbi:hypothetical protein INT45_001890 [Circinella minor]|uniref:RRM domain-containing protein n=1 Tax=Circinella minor TaxID=1195481 RepID=A0A8H7S1W7_9FUNG|nr:hypothetical protein INT45_001890 [Circinella minor]
MNTAMDLDTALDDIIKKRKNNNSSKNQKHKQQQQRQNNKTNKGPSNNNNNKNNKVGNGRRNNNNHNTIGKSFNNNHNVRPGGKGTNNNLTISSRSKTINKARNNNTFNLRRAGGINGRQQKQQLQERQKNNNVSSSVKPSDIVITKKVPRNNNNNNNFNKNSGRINQYPQGIPSTRIPTQMATKRGFAIRGSSYGSSSMMYNGVSNGISIRGESGPAIVLISNLDPGTNAEDIRMICLQFGQVSNCDIAVDQMGRSVGEAEVEFVHKQSALDCINKLDNEVADGRILRVILRDRPTGVLNGYMNQTVRSAVIAPTRSGFTSA